MPDRPDFLDKKRGYPATAAEFEDQRRRVRRQLDRRYAATIAEDAVAEATQALLRRHSSGEALRNWKAYFYACAVHAASALKREETRRRSAERGRALQSLGDADSLGADELRRMLARLAPSDRELLSVWANSDTSIEAARTLGLSRSTFYARLRNILERLRARQSDER